MNIFSFIVTTGLLIYIIIKLKKMADELTVLEQEVAENSTAIGSAVTLLQGLKAALDAAGTDPVKLKALSDQLSAQTDALAAAVVANTPSEGEGEEGDEEEVKKK